MKQLDIIQNNLAILEETIKIFEKENIMDFSVIALQGMIVCESMLEFILNQKGIKVDKGKVLQEEKIGHTSKHVSIITYCTVINKTILPIECINFLKLISHYRNLAATYVTEFNKEMISDFSQALNYFIAWFTEQYINKNSFDEVLKNIPKKNAHPFESVLFKIMQELIVDNTTPPILLKKMDEKMNKTYELMNIIYEIVNNTDKNTEYIKNTVDEINKQIRELTNQIYSYQSLVKRQIDKADSDMEIDKIIQGYTDECVERIIKTTKENSEKKELEIERKKLITSIGKTAWKKLDKSSKTFLISAKLMYNNLILVDDQIDYSGVCVLVTKALEVELSKRFYSNFLNYLNDTYQDDYSQYHTALLFQGSSPLKPEKFTMGKIAYAMCYLENKSDSNKQKTTNKERLLEYSKNKLFPKKMESEIISILNEYAYAIEKIRVNYRNPSAHTNELQQIDAEECFNLVLDVEKLLKRMLDSFIE